MSLSEIFAKIEAQKAENRELLRDRLRRAEIVAELIAEGQAFLARDPNDRQEAAALILQIRAFYDRVPAEVVNVIQSYPAFLRIIGELQAQRERLNLTWLTPHSAGSQSVN